jgi:glycosyltransferase involved in cell wall biosynthesis
MKAVIIIPTTGADVLDDAVRSAIGQTYSQTDVWVIIDGPQFAPAAYKILNQYPTVKHCMLPENTGSGGWYGHRIYAAMSFLFNHDFVLYLDQDNWFDPDHVSVMISTCIAYDFDWCYGLRKIFDARCNYICDDDCESLGRWPIYFNDNLHLVDTSTYCIRRSVITRLAGAWYSGWGGDRRFYSVISREAPNFGCTGLATVGYRLDGNPDSVNADFFIKGNLMTKQRYPNGYPWRFIGFK